MNRLAKKRKFHLRDVNFQTILPQECKEVQVENSNSGDFGLHHCMT